MIIRLPNTCLLIVVREGKQNLKSEIMLFSTDSLSPRLLRNFERIVVIRLVTRSVTCPKINSTETNFKKNQRIRYEKKKNIGKRTFHWTWERTERHRKTIVSNIFEKHLLAHCVLCSTTMDQNTNERTFGNPIYSNSNSSIAKLSRT